MEELVAVRTTKDFQVRSDFGKRADILHEVYPQELGFTEEQQVAAHNNSFDDVLMTSQKRDANPSVLQGIEVKRGKRALRQSLTA